MKNYTGFKQACVVSDNNELREVNIHSINVKVRVGKCHGYDGYIRVKKLGSWGKKFGMPK